MRNFKRFSQGDSVHGYRCQDHRVALLKADNKTMHYGLKLLKAQEADDEPQCCQCQYPLDLSTRTLSKYKYPSIILDLYKKVVYYVSFVKH